LLETARVPEIKGLEISQVSQFDGSIDAFCAGTSGNIPVIIMRSQSYLNWRYVIVPKTTYTIYLAKRNQEISGYMVLRHRQMRHMKVAVIYELFAESADIAQCLINYAMDNCTKDSTDYIHWSGIANKSFSRAFRKRGFFSLPLRMSQSRFVLFLSGSDVSRDLLATPDNWLVQTGDSDIL
jgi:hypothetical protein